MVLTLLIVKNLQHQLWRILAWKIFCHKVRKLFCLHFLRELCLDMKQREKINFWSFQQVFERIDLLREFPVIAICYIQVLLACRTGRLERPVQYMSVRAKRENEHEAHALVYCVDPANPPVLQATVLHEVYFNISPCL